MTALERAARLKDEFPEVNIGNYNEEDVERLNAWGCEVYDLLAALALPPDGGEVVERAARIIDSVHPESPRGLDAANALHAAGLLAGDVPDREWLARWLSAWRYTNGKPVEGHVYSAAPVDYEGADAILREMGR